MTGKKTYHKVDSMDKRNSIRIGLVGCVSCGKSTLLNSICVNQYEEMKKCRTTMLPSVYQETNNTIYSSEEAKEILNKNTENNHYIFNGSVELSNENCKVVRNMIPKIKDFANLSDNIFIDIYDIPGLNDAKTRDIYYKWIEDNFSELDIIIHIVDINSPLNTSDQIDILKMLIKNIDQEKKKNGRDVFLLTVVNKCDEMDQEGGDFVMDEEDQENYDNIIKTTNEIIEEIIGPLDTVVEGCETKFATPVNVSSKLRKFLKLEDDELISRTEVTKRITGYCKSRNLVDKKDKRKINIDSELKNLLMVEDDKEITFFNIQMYISKHFPQKNSFNYDFTPISAADTFVYRMLHNDPTVEMDMKLLQKFGMNEVGRRAWNKMNEVEKREMIKGHFKKAKISDTLEITGYLQFTEILKNYLSKDRQSKILIDRIKQELQNEDLIKKNITTDKDELQKLIQIYNSYSSRVWVVDKLFKTNNSSIVTDLINTHISRWISDISDLSNGSAESIKRLEEYKYAVNEIREKVDPYALSNNIKMKIDEEKGKRWSDSFGKSFQEYKKAIPHSMIFGLKSLMDGYSNLQNQYYIRILENENTYYDFPNNIYSNIDKLRENSYDSVESTIDYVIQKIEKTILSKCGQELESWLQQTKSPFSGYYETCEESLNTIIQFCEKLMSDYCYPKEKIIEFLKSYLIRRYGIMNHCHPGETHSIFEIQAHYPTCHQVVNLSRSDGQGGHYVKSYIILLDTWWQNKGGKDDNEYFNNLYFVNKSNLFRANSLNYSDNHALNYYKEKNNILAIPMYLYGLMNEDESDESEEDEYSSTCADDGLSDDESE